MQAHLFGVEQEWFVKVRALSGSRFSQVFVVGGPSPLILTGGLTIKSQVGWS